MQLPHVRRTLTAAGFAYLLAHDLVHPPTGISIGIALTREKAASRLIQSS